MRFATDGVDAAVRPTPFGHRIESLVQVLLFKIDRLGFAA
jgi:hypothetical protein